jgi:two-component system sensor histidine kinase KdpD
LNRNWYAVYVQTPSEEPTVIDARTQRLLADTLTLANQLGATVFTFKGQDVADTILRFAREYRVGNVIIGRPRPIPWWKRMAGERSVAEQLVRRSGGVTVIVVDVEAEEPPVDDPPPGATRATRGTSAGLNGSAVGGALSPERIIIWEDPVSRDTIFRHLVGAVGDAARVPADEVLDRLLAREKAGSTFLNEGVALPHARVEGLTEPQVALGLTHGGVLDSPAERPIEAVFMLLSPAQGANAHLQLLAKAARLLQSRELRRRLAKVRTAIEALDEIRGWEHANLAPTGPRGT